MCIRDSFYTVLIREKTPLKIPYQRQYVSLVLLLLTAALFIPIRGGFSVSTMNLSKVYYSQNQRMNHAAINPAFSFMYSATHQNNFDKMCIRDRLFSGLLCTKALFHAYMKQWRQSRTARVWISIHHKNE